jgi:hypothetical protein|tara:strand:+ start:315 stop:482 length:168 start_codon:yes stop_codon:yes gene_type:complete
MNNLRRKLLKFSIIQFFTLFISTKSFAQNIVFKKIKSYKKKEFNGFIWYLDERDQ